MIFKDKMNEFNLQLKPLINNFVELACKNQTHYGDIFLILRHAFFNNNIPEGPFFLMKTEDKIETAEREISRYMKWYTSESKFVQEKYKMFSSDAIDFPNYKISIIQEKMIYLNYWEAETTLYYLYQLARLCNKLPYDWRWKQKLKKYNCRQEFIRKYIKVPMKKIDKEIYLFFIEIIKRQIRNAIAHSQYCLLNNGIEYLNYSACLAKYSSLQFIKYSEWEDKIHKTIVFRSLLLDEFNRANEYYEKMAKKNSNKIQIRMTKENGEFNYGIILL